MNWIKIKQHDWDKLRPESKEKSQTRVGYKFRLRSTEEKKLLLEEERRLKRDML